MPDLDWQTVTFYPVALGEIPADPVFAYTDWLPGANNVLDGAFGVLEHLALAAHPGSLDTGRYVLYIDNIKNGPVGAETVIADFELPHVAGDEVMFQEPTNSSSTNMHLLPSLETNVAEVDATQGDAGSSQSLKVVFQFKDEELKRWLRLTTVTGDPVQPIANPQVDLAHPITMSIRLYGVACNDPFADADGDGDVDGDDFGAYQKCVTGVGGGLLPGCDCFDTEPDDDVDQDDLGPFEACASGPNVPALTSCDGGP